MLADLGEFFVQFKFCLCNTDIQCIEFLLKLFCHPCHLIAFGLVHIHHPFFHVDIGECQHNDDDAGDDDGNDGDPLG